MALNQRHTGLLSAVYSTRDINRGKYIAGMVFPDERVNDESFQYRILDRDVRIDDLNTGDTGTPRTVSDQSQLKSGRTATKAVRDLVSRKEMDKVERDGSDLTADDLRMMAAETCTEYLLREKEKAAADILADDANFQSSLVVNVANAEKFDAANSDPVKYILTQREKMNYEPNLMVMPLKVYNRLRSNSKIQDAVKGGNTSSGVVSMEQLAALFDVETILVGRARYNSAAAGQSEVISFIWGNNDLYLLHNDGSRFGAKFGMNATFGEPRVRVYADEGAGPDGGEYVSVAQDYGLVIPVPEAGLKLKGITS